MPPQYLQQQMDSAPHVMPETAFVPSSASERPTHCNVNRSQRKTPGCSNLNV
jgi:hypothetical protein